MFSTVAEMSILVTSEQFSKAEFPMLVAPFILILVRLEHPSKADSPMLTTLAGIFMLVRLVHPENAKSSILMTFAGILMSVKLRQSENALNPMLTTVYSLPLICTFSGMEKFSILEKRQWLTAAVESVKISYSNSSS